MPRVLLINDDAVVAYGIYQVLVDSGYKVHLQATQGAGNDAVYDAIVIDQEMPIEKAMLDLAPFAMLLVSEQGLIVAHNTQVEQIFGYAHGEMMGLSIECLVPDRFRNAHLIHRDRYNAQPRIRPMGNDLELRGLRKDGSEFPVQISLNPIIGVSGAAVAVGIRDLSKDKEVEAQLRELTVRLQSIREEERLNLSRALHDQLGQNLTAIKMDVAWMQRHPKEEHASAQGRLQGMLTMIDETMETVRQIATQLRPAILDDIGLEAAIEWQISEFEALTGIRSTFTSEIDTGDGSASLPLLLNPSGSTPEIDSDLVTTAFRIFQEALTNVHRHAAATRIDVSLAITKDSKAMQGVQLHMRIHDNGRGIEDMEIRSLNSIGLLGMRERARSVGGEVQISGIAGQGTTVDVRLPIKSVDH